MRRSVSFNYTTMDPIDDASAMKMDDPPAKKARKEDDSERVERAARMILKSPILSVPQVRV